MVPSLRCASAAVVTLGALEDRTPAAGDRLVTAHDEQGQAWWIAASAVWSDADGSGHPENPLPIGLATAATREEALVAGLSDRLGWEAVLEFERGPDLPVAEALPTSATTMWSFSTAGSVTTSPPSSCSARTWCGGAPRRPGTARCAGRCTATTATPTCAGAARTVRAHGSVRPRRRSRRPRQPAAPAEPASPVARCRSSSRVAAEPTTPTTAWSAGDEPADPVDAA